MIKVIYNINTGRILGSCVPGQDLNAVISNYSDCDYIEVEEFSLDKLSKKYQVNLETKQIEIVPPIEV